MHRAVGIIMELLEYGLTLKDLSGHTLNPTSHLSRVKNGKVRPRDFLTANLVQVRDSQRSIIAQQINVLHCCVVGRRPLADSEKSEISAAAYVALRRAIRSPDRFNADKFTISLPDGIDAITLGIGPCVLIATRTGLTEEAAAKLSLHEVKEYEKTLRRTLRKYRVSGPDRAF